VISATRTTPTTVVLVVPQFAGCLNQQLRISDVTDLAGNPVDPNPTTVSFLAPVILLTINDTQQWRYDYSGIDRSALPWTQPGYDDSAWEQGPAILAWEPDNNTAPYPIRTVLSNTVTLAAWNSTNITTYFRTHFNLPTATQNITRLDLYEVLDDGAVYYFNGVEVHRTRVNTGPLTYNTQATTTGAEPHPLEGPTTIPTTGLVEGDNVIAVAVHQSGTASSDIVFGMELLAQVSGCQPALHFTSVGANVYQLTWSDPTFQLQQAPSVTGPWAIVPGAASGMTVTIPATGNGFLRLIKP
jgi:hypothetical protein